MSFLSGLLKPEPDASPQYRDLVIGLASGVAGTLLMGQWSTRIAPLVTANEPKSSGKKPDQDVISPLGQQHKPGESSTAALGRHAYEAVNDKEPRKDTITALSEGMHWATGIIGGAVYSTLAGRHHNPLTGMAYGAAQWLILDELITPLLGLQDGPRAASPTLHASRLGAHLAYGLGLGLTAYALSKALPE